MSYIVKRILVGVAIGLIMMFARHAFAADGVYYRGDYGGVVGAGATVSDACQALVANVESAKIFSFAVTFKSAALGRFGCWFDIQRPPAQGGLLSDAGDITEVQGPLPPGLCLLGMERGPDGHCVCKAGTHEVNGACFPNKSELEQFCETHAAPPRSTFNMTGTIGIASDSPESSCYKPYPPFGGADATRGCVMTLRDFLKVPSDDGKLANWSATGMPTGGVCEDAAATDDAPKSTPDKCPGGFAGTVNNIERCIPAEPDKGIDGVKTGTKVDANGTKHETKETTKCEGTVCTTTTTTTSTTTSNSVSTTTTSVTESLADKCQKDPANKVCTKTGTTPTKGTGSGKGEDGGRCEDGDKTVGCMEAGEPPGNSEIPRTNKTVSFEPVAISGFGQACPQSTTFDVYGRTFTASYQPLCDSAGWIRPLILLVAALASTMIVYQAIRGNR